MNIVFHGDNTVISSSIIIGSNSIRIRCIWLPHKHPLSVIVAGSAVLLWAMVLVELTEVITSWRNRNGGLFSSFSVKGGFLPMTLPRVSWVLLTIASFILFSGMCVVEIEHQGQNKPFISQNQIWRQENSVSTQVFNSRMLSHNSLCTRAIVDILKYGIWSPWQ